MSNILEGKISGIAFGGQGICRHGALVVFIPFTAVEDIIRYRIIEQKKNFAHGELIEVLQRSPQRITPLCPYFTHCGGCQLQHLQYTAQLEYKRQAIEDAIKRQAKLYNAMIPQVICDPQQWAYRRRISLSLESYQGKFRAGYTSIDHVSLVPIRECRIFCDPSDPIILIVQEIAQALQAERDNHAKATVLKDGRDKYLLHFHFKAMPSNAAEILEASSHRFNCLKGIVATSPKSILQYGDVEGTFEVEELAFTFTPRTFVQNHPAQSKNITDSLCRLVLANTPPKGKILDLYCGIGVSSLLLAKQGFQVTGVEVNKDAVQLAKHNARNNGITHSHFIQANVEKILMPLLNEISPDTVIVNPPREGLHPSAIAALLKNKPPAILYVSCMPPTLARDLKILCAHTYALQKVEGYDMFPQTAHVETLVLLKIQTSQQK